MVGVERIQFDLLDNAEHLGLVSIISPALEKIRVEQCQATTRFCADILASRAKFDSAMGRLRKSELTAEKREDNGIRDEDMAYIGAAVDLYLKKRGG